MPSRPTGMTVGAARFTRTTRILLAAAAGLLAAGCAAAGHSASSSPGAAGGPRNAAVPAPAAAGHSAARGGAALAGLASSQSVIYTASLTVRAGNLTRAATGATQLARAAGGYVSAEDTALDRAHPGRSTVSLQLKVPVASYQRVLGALVGLGTRQAESQHAQDVTQTVADVTSRVASARAAITQLRKLLARAGSVSSLLDVQNQINTEEASLEALQAQQRALAHETAYGTVSLLLVAKPAAGVKQEKRSGGFLRGLAAGWHGLARVVVALLTAAGAALPFAVILAAAGYLGWRGRRWLLRHRSAAGPGSAAAD